MSFRAIKGTFHVVGYSPDGDSIRFKAKNSANWAFLYGTSVKMNAKKHAQLRIEAIDTLETHYKTEHQPLTYAKLATDYLFDQLGITNVIWSASGSRVSSANDGTPGYILTRTTDPFGRPVSFVFDDSQSFTDGSIVYINKTIAKKSVNYKILKKGLAYPTFYDGMFYDLRELFADCTVTARQNGNGVWSADKTNKYFKINGLQDLTDNIIMMPKLFRRIVAYIKEYGAFDPHDFVDDLEDKREKVLVISILHFTHLDNLIRISPTGRIKLTQKPENLVFLS